MKIIEAMKRVKLNKQKMEDMKGRIAKSSANHSHENPVYGAETGKRIAEWIQACLDLSQENIRLLTSIARTNLVTPVTIELGGKHVTKTIAEWVWRRREYALLDRQVYALLTDRNLQTGQMGSSTGGIIPITVVRHYDPLVRDEKMALYAAEPHLIDSALEVVNAITDIIDEEKKA